MKTAISINDELLQRADETAQRMGLSRSALIALAVGDFLEKRRQGEMLVRLNEVYGGDADAAGSSLAKAIKVKTRKVKIRDRW